MVVLKKYKYQQKTAYHKFSVAEFLISLNVPEILCLFHRIVEYFEL